MDPTTVRQAAEWTGGHVAGGARKDPVGPDVVIDSRKATPGSVFVAIPGERVDGHDHLPPARPAPAWPSWSIRSTTSSRRSWSRTPSRASPPSRGKFSYFNWRECFQ